MNYTIEEKVQKVILYKGKFFLDDCHVSIFQPGFYFGLSVYETLLVKGKTVLFYEEHLTRLHSNLEFLKFSCSTNFVSSLREGVTKIIKHELFSEEEYIRLRITVVPSDTFISNVDSSEATVILIAQTIPKSQQNKQSFSFYIASILKSQNNLLPEEMKLALNLFNLCAMREAVRNGCDEALLFNSAGFLSEGSFSNIFILREGKVFTPKLSNNLLAGVTRAKVLQLLGKMNFRVVEENNITFDECVSADSIFLTSSIRGIKPIISIKVDKHFFNFNFTSKRDLEYHFNIAPDLVCIMQEYQSLIDSTSSSVL